MLKNWVFQPDLTTDSRECWLLFIEIVLLRTIKNILTTLPAGSQMSDSDLTRFSQ